MFNPDKYRTDIKFMEKPFEGFFGDSPPDGWKTKLIKGQRPVWLLYKDRFSGCCSIVYCNDIQMDVAFYLDPPDFVEKSIRGADNADARFEYFDFKRGVINDIVESLLNEVAQIGVAGESSG